MDFILDIILLRNELENLNIIEECIEWGGEMLSQEPPKYIYNSVLKFHESIDNYYQKKIENFDNEKYIILTLEGSQVSSLSGAINKGKDISQDDLMLFFNALYNKLDKFHIFLYKDEECIDREYVISDEKEFVVIFCSALNWLTPQGIAISKI